MPLLERLRQARPDEAFTLSMRQNWDGLRTDEAEMRAALEGFVKAGVQHLMASPRQSDLDGWLRSVDALHAVLEDYR